MKESIFNVLGASIIDAKVLDLFSGTGSLGIESLSRGCSLAYFVDKNIKAIKLIEHNTSSLKNIENKYKIIRKDVLRFIRRFDELKFDIVFVDPPYKIDSNIMRDVFKVLAGKKVTKSDTIIIYEYFFKKDVSDEIKTLKVLKKTFFGDKIVSYMTPLEN